jgi:hypothetical protein
MNPRKEQGRPKPWPDDQMSEFNALNACLAIIRFKQLRGFYFKEIRYFHLPLEIGDLKIGGESEL